MPHRSPRPDAPTSAGGRVALAVATASDRIVALVCRVALLVTGTALLVILFANVVARYALHRRWVRLRSGTAGAAVPMVHRGGRRLAAQHGGHMSVEWLLERSGRHAQRLLILGGNLLVIVSYVVLCRQALLVADIAAAERSPVLGLPNSHGYWAMAAACALLVLATAAISVRVALFGRRRCPSPIPRRCRHEHSPRDRLLRPMVLVIPVGHAIIASGAALLWQGSLPLLLVAQQMFAQTQSFPMLALPFFMLAGSLMMGGRLGQELLACATQAMAASAAAHCPPPWLPRSRSGACPAAPSPTPARSARS